MKDLSLEMNFLKKMRRYGYWYYNFLNADHIEVRKTVKDSIEVKVFVGTRRNVERWGNLGHAWNSVKCEIDKYEKEHSSSL